MGRRATRGAHTEAGNTHGSMEMGYGPDSGAQRAPVRENRWAARWELVRYEWALFRATLAIRLFGLWLSLLRLFGQAPREMDKIGHYLKESTV